MFAYGELGPLGDKIQTEHARVHHALVQSQVFVGNERSFNNLTLYQQRIARNVHRNTRLLWEMQDRRKVEERLEAKPKPLTRTASIINEENGFGFSFHFRRPKPCKRGKRGPDHPAESRVTAQPTMKNSQTSAFIREHLRLNLFLRSAPRPYCDNLAVRMVSCANSLSHCATTRRIC
jgi:hypothetical protein